MCRGIIVSVLLPCLVYNVDFCQCNRRRMGDGWKASSTVAWAVMLHRIQEKNLWTVKPLAIEAAVSSLAFQARFTFPCITQHGRNYNRLAGAISIIRTILAERCVQLRLNPNLVLLPLITITADYLTGLKRSEFQRLLATPMTAK